LNSDRLDLVQLNFFCPFFSIFNSERCSVGLLFPAYRAQKLMKEGVEEWETKGFTAAVGWGLVDQGGYVFVDRITADRMTCVSKSSDYI
jgi:hypothetical protein